MPKLACARLIIRFDCALTLELGDRHRSASKVRHHQRGQKGWQKSGSGREIAPGIGSNRKSQHAITRTLKRAREASGEAVHEDPFTRTVAKLLGIVQAASFARVRVRVHPEVNGSLLH
jgi:hypothetical protein